MTPYHPAKHHADVVRIWEECGWIERDNAEQKKGLAAFAAANRTWVHEHHGAAEIAVFLTDGTLYFHHHELPLAAVTAVTAGLVYRQRGGSSRLLTQALAHDAQQGRVVAGLGIFDQGYYDRLGFGTGCYEHWYQFDPVDLRVPRLERAPERLTLADADAIHASRCATLRGHGDCILFDPGLTRAEILLSKSSFGLGFRAGETITHHIWLQVEDLEKSTWEVLWYSYQTRQQFIELLSLLASLGDQVRSVFLHEPPWLQLQELIARPFRAETIRRSTPQPSVVSADAYWQMRILAVDRAIAVWPPSQPALTFRLVLSDPIARYCTDASDRWRGCGGTYFVTLDDQPRLEIAPPTADCPTLTCAVGAFTRLWLGVANASTLAALGEIAAPPHLIAELDRRVPAERPYHHWDF